jgi:hypothetical protein
MKRYIKPVSTLIKMDQQLLLAGTNGTNLNSDAGWQISGQGGDDRGGIKDKTSGEVRGGLDFAKKNFMPFDDSDDNMNW